VKIKRNGFNSRLLDKNKGRCKVNTFYFNDKNKRLETKRPKNSHTEIKTEKCLDVFGYDFFEARFQGNSIIDSIEIAR
jgi:hypothetical protein